MNRWLLFGGLALAVYLFTRRRMFANILARQVMRSDRWGGGNFGAARGNRTHQGLDLVTEPGEAVRAPIDGRVVRFGFVYSGDNLYRLLVLQGEGYDVRLMYVYPAPRLRPGDTVQRGDVVGTSQAISARYGPGMLDHVHIEVRRIVGGELRDPAGLLKLEL